MTDYTELIKALRRCDMKQGCFNANCRYSVGKYFCDMDKVHKDAAAAIESLQAEVKALIAECDSRAKNGRQIQLKNDELRAEVKRLEDEVRLWKNARDLERYGIYSDELISFEPPQEVQE